MIKPGNIKILQTPISHLIALNLNYIVCYKFTWLKELTPLSVLPQR